MELLTSKRKVNEAGRYVKALLLIGALIFNSCAQASELSTLDHKVLGDKRIYLRDKTDKRYSVWTSDRSKAEDILKQFNFPAKQFTLPKGKILVVFLNDDIAADLAAIVYNKATNQTFGDFADSGIRFKLQSPPAGKKYSHVTAVIFKPIGMPSHIGIRNRVLGGLSEKK